jgi:hypothetical protein
MEGGFVVELEFGADPARRQQQSVNPPFRTFINPRGRFASFIISIYQRYPEKQVEASSCDILSRYAYAVNYPALPWPESQFIP